MILIKCLLSNISASSTSKVLMKVSLDLVEQNECNRSYSFTMGKKLASGIDPNSQICAGKISGGKDTCQVYKIIFNRIQKISHTLELTYLTSLTKLINFFQFLYGPYDINHVSIQYYVPTIGNEYCHLPKTVNEPLATVCAVQIMSALNCHNLL